ncbi:MAG: cytochrome c biogenesis protein ResB, partial [Nitrospiraceae bacterium]
HAEGGGTVQALRGFFRKKKWYFRQGRADNTCFAVKNRYSPIGFILFHFSFFLCLLGGLMIMYTRFSGKLPLTEGQQFNGDMAQFRTVIKDPKVMKELPSLGLYLQKVEPSYENDVPTELVTYVAVRYEDEIKNEVLRVNEPIKRGPMSILAESIGVSPLFVVRGPGGRQIDAAYTSLNVLNGEEDSFQFETDRRFVFNVKFYPDYVVEQGVEKTLSIELKNPAIHLEVLKGGIKVYEGTIGRGEPAQIDLFSISFEDIRYWAEFLLVREYGKLPLTAGFVLASIGLIMRLVFYQKSLRFAIEYEGEKPILYMDGRSEYFQHSYRDEKEKIAEELEGYLSKALIKETGGT